MCCSLLQMQVDSPILRRHSAFVNLDNLGYYYKVMRPANVSSRTPDVMLVESVAGLDQNADMYRTAIELPNTKVCPTLATYQQLRIYFNLFLHLPLFLARSWLVLTEDRPKLSALRDSLGSRRE